jgi:capsular exopolysaccharide synthesis family protein
MSKIFQALNKSGVEGIEPLRPAARTATATVEADAPGQVEVAPGGAARPAPRTVEWKPGREPGAQPATGPAARRGVFLAGKFRHMMQPREAAPSGGGAATAVPAPAPANTALAPRQRSRVDIRTLPIMAASGHPILPFDSADTLVTEGYRKVRTHLLQLPSQPGVIVVSSPSQGDGKTLTSINLAGTLALKRDASVVLVEADLRRGDIAARCGLPQGPGLGDYLADRCKVEDALVRVEQLPNLYVIVGGQYRANPVELLDSERWHNLVANLRRKFRFVIIDVPPMGLLADYDLAQTVADGVIVVVRQDYTNRATLKAALASIPARKRLGVVMNAARETYFQKRQQYGYYQGTYTTPGD